MKLVIQNLQEYGYALRGVCPHCSVVSLCTPVAKPHFYRDEELGAGPRDGTSDGLCTITQCQNCHGFVLLLTRLRDSSSHDHEHRLEEYYPSGTADDSVDDAVPEKIAEDFSEALRCFHVESYRATVTMCRRAIQASSKEFKAAGDKLIHQIDDLAKKGKITEPLKDMAHQIRKIGNDGAHPGDDLLKDVTEQDAAGIIEFVREYFAHVYIMPRKLEAMKKRKVKSA